MTTASLDRRLDRVEMVVERRGPDLAQLLHDALAAHGREAVVALCQKHGVTLERVERWAVEPWRHEPGTVRRP